MCNGIISRKAEVGGLYNMNAQELPPLSILRTHTSATVQLNELLMVPSNKKEQINRYASYWLKDRVNQG